MCNHQRDGNDKEKEKKTHLFFRFDTPESAILLFQILYTAVSSLALRPLGLDGTPCARHRNYRRLQKIETARNVRRVTTVIKRRLLLYTPAAKV